MGSGYRDFYTIETQARRDEYNEYIDEEGKLARDLGELDGYGAPEVLESDVKPSDELLGGVKGLLGEKGGKGKEKVDIDIEIRLSKDPRNFMCGLVYYAGLVERWRVDEDGNVTFLHVRSSVEEDFVREGREVALAVIRAAVRIIERGRAGVEDVDVDVYTCRNSQSCRMTGAGEELEKSSRLS